MVSCFGFEWKSSLDSKAKEKTESKITHTHTSTKEKHSFAFILLKFMQYKKGIEWTLAPNENNTNEANKQVTNSFLIKSQHQKEKLYLFIALLLLFFFSLSSTSNSLLLCKMFLSFYFISRQKKIGSFLEFLFITWKLCNRKEKHLMCFANQIWSNEMRICMKFWRETVTVKLTSEKCAQKVGQIPFEWRLQIDL